MSERTETTVGKFRDITLERVRELAPGAFQEALKRYPHDVEGALIFFGTAIGLNIAKPTEADIAWAVECIRNRNRL